MSFVYFGTGQVIKSWGPDISPKTSKHDFINNGRPRGVERIDGSYN